MKLQVAHFKLCHSRAFMLRCYPLQTHEMLFDAHNTSVAEHQRVFTRDHSGPARTVYDWRHYLAVVQRKPGALRNGAPSTTLPASLRTFSEPQRTSKQAPKPFSRCHQCSPKGTPFDFNLPDPGRLVGR
jgi:hypothetical protein